jgi:hypothetical protein
MPFSNTLMLTVHGVNSTNEGFKRITQICQQELPGLLVDNFYFGQTKPFTQLNYPYRQFLFRTLRSHLEYRNSVQIIPHRRRLFIVAHSFGTLAIIRALEMGVPQLCIDGLILLGSIVPQDQYWGGFIGTGCLSHPPLAIIRPFDTVVARAHLVGGSPSGSEGFIPTGLDRPREVYKNGGHSAYDPADAPEIISAIRNGVASVKEKDETTWLSEQSLARRMALVCKKVLF